MFVTDAKSFDWVSAWKATSIVLTGAFGVLGLMTNFTKDHDDPKTGEKRRKITRWGYVSLAGILISTIFGAAAQIKESRGDASKSLAVAQQSQQLLRGMEGLLLPLDGPA